MRRYNLLDGVDWHHANTSMDDDKKAYRGIFEVWMKGDETSSHIHKSKLADLEVIPAGLEHASAPPMPHRACLSRMALTSLRWLPPDEVVCSRLLIGGWPASVRQAVQPWFVCICEHARSAAGQHSPWPSARVSLPWREA